ncbi:beta-glucosidase, partial [Lecanoromycetidae sp. Uapishka_2]
MADIDIESGRGFESYSEDPFLSGTLAGEYCKGVQQENIVTTPKHFVCNDQEDDRMGVNRFGTYSTSEGINAGLDLEMPGPTRWRGEMLSHAVKNNKVPRYVLDERVRAVLKTIRLAAKSGIPEDAPERKLDRPRDREFLRDVAAESIVLLKNKKGILPLDKSRTVVIIGPNSRVAAFSGGGSASLLPYYTVTPYEGVAAQCGDTRLSQGAYSHKELPLLGYSLRNADGEIGFNFKAYDKPVDNPDRKLLDHLHLSNSYMHLSDHIIANYSSSLYYVDVTGTFTPEEDGVYDFGLTVQGTGRLFIDGKLLVDNVHDQTRGTAFFSAGTIEKIGSLELISGKSYALSVEFGSAPTAEASERSSVSGGAGGLRIGGCKRIDPNQAVADAVQLASQVDQVVVFAGLNADWESESFDRPNMDLPPGIDELINKVLEVNPRTTVVIQSGTPVTMPWADKANAILQAWYGGNETGNAIADVLFGNVNPSGKLPLSFPVQIEDNPAFLNYSSERGRVLYGEDIYVGYRYYEKVKRQTLFPFGHGLSYTTFTFSNLKVSTHGSSVSVRLRVSNTGQVAGAEVVQVYIHACSPSVNRPYKELKGFQKVFVDAKGNTEVDIEMDKKNATSFWDEDRDMWIMEKGEYQVLVGNSSQCDFLQGSFEVDETAWWSGLGDD